MRDLQMEIDALNLIRQTVPVGGWFPGDDNHQAIDAQILVLRDGLSIDTVRRMYGRSGHLLIQAEHALDWRDGRDKVSPSEGWKRKVRL